MTRTRMTRSAVGARLALGLMAVLLSGACGPEPEAVGESPPVEVDAEPESRLSMYLSLAVHSDGRADALDALRRGLERAAAGNAAEATSEYERAGILYPGIEDWATVLAAEAAAAAGDTAAVRALLEPAEPQLVREWGWRAVSQGRLAAGDRVGAVAALTEAAATLPTGELRAEAWARAARLRLVVGDTAAARESLVAALDAEPMSEHGLTAARLLSELSDPSPTERAAVARVFLRHGNLDRGLSAADAYPRGGGGTAVERAGLGLAAGRALFRARRYTDAEKRLESLAGDSAAPRDVAAEALLLAGRAQLRDGRRTEAIRTFRRVAARYPGEPAAAHALFIVGDLAHDDGRTAAARDLYQRAVDAAPQTVHGAEAAVRLGGMAMIGGDHDRAISVFESLRALHDDGPIRQRATYWAGRSQLEAGQDSVGRARLAEALRLDPASWYGLRAADRLRTTAWHRSLQPSPATDDSTAIEVRGALARLDLLAEVGRPGIVGFEMDRVRRHFARRGGGLYALAEAFHDRGETFRAISIGRAIQRGEDGWNERLLRIIYPFPYQATIEAEATGRGIDPYLVAGLIRQESMFNPDARSPVGAIGLMQLMPRTGRALAERARAGAVSEARLHQPELNLRLGILHVSDLLARYDRPVDMLAAYNAGAGRLARWRGLPEYVDADLFAERIPYEETREYVKAVQQNARIYRALYGSDHGPREPEGVPLSAHAIDDVPTPRARISSARRSS